MINFPDAPTMSQIHTVGAASWVWDGVKWLAGGAAAKYIVGCFVPGVLTASQTLLEHRYTKAVTLPANLGAYLGHATAAGGGVPATASTAIILGRPTAASGQKDAPNEVQSPDLMALTASLTKALQEAMARIEALEGAAPA